MSLIQGYDAFDTVGIQQIIGVDPADQVTRGQPKSFVDRVGLTMIALVYNHIDSVAVLVDDRHGVVGRAAVDEDVFDVGVCLCQD